ncbi:Aste57867_13988 [Aphanomyces stellatus]|uniref:Aste57867_13988 protein n=1 Tax=Aphanomyces stellatus TaxID=120398 RepID=A0A485L092_9STRA|nr:hypothetical protein As57867_013937 [Aphanomyces stellatus]VFT90818.1 Aste57867_13988 [Aphanomyces stellatus]
MEHVFHERGDLGIRIDFDDHGHVFVKKIEDVAGLAELSCPDLVEGDVFVSINSTSVIGLPFTDIMKRLREACASRGEHDVVLTFVPIENSFKSAAQAVEEWQTQELKALDDGEFEVVFPASEPLGFRLTESFLMTQPLCVAATSIEALTPLLHHAIVKINEHVVLAAPAADVVELLHDPTQFPKHVWFWDISNDTSCYSIVTLRSRGHVLPSLQLMPKDVMFEVPMVHSLLPAIGGDKPNLHAFSSARDDGICKDQYLMAVNGIPTLTMPHAAHTVTASSHITMLHSAMESLRGVPRRLLFRDVRLYQREFRQHRPLSPWKRRRPTSATLPSTHETAADEGDDAVEIETRSSEFAVLVAAATPAATPSDVTSPVRWKWSQGHVRRVIIPPSSQCAPGTPLGLQFETDFSSKFTVFKRYLRSTSDAKKTLREGDRIISINGVPVGDIPTDTLVQVIQGADVGPRTFVVACAASRLATRSLWPLPSWRAMVHSTLGFANKGATLDTIKIDD